MGEAKQAVSRPHSRNHRLEGLKYVYLEEELAESRKVQSFWDNIKQQSSDSE